VKLQYTVLSSVLNSSMNLSLSTTFLAMAPFALVAVGIFYGIEQVEGEHPEPTTKDILNSFKNPTVLRLSTVSATTFVIFSLLVSAVPLQINEILGVSSIGYLSSATFFVLALCAVFGPQIDRFGRNRILIFSYITFLAGLGSLLFANGMVFFLVIGVICVGIAFAFFFVTMFTLAECAPEPKQPGILAVIASVDDVTVAVMMFLSAILEGNNISSTYLYIFAIVITLVSWIAVSPLMGGGNDLDEAKQRLAE